MINECPLLVKCIVNQNLFSFLWLMKYYLCTTSTLDSRCSLASGSPPWCHRRARWSRWARWLGLKYDNEWISIISLRFPFNVNLINLSCCLFSTFDYGKIFNFASSCLAFSRFETLNPSELLAYILRSRGSFPFKGRDFQFCLVMSRFLKIWDSQSLWVVGLHT